MFARIRQMVIALVTLVVLVSALPYTAVAASTTAPINAHLNSTSICLGSPIPPGWVITKIYPRTVSCAGLDAFQIQPYGGQNMSICMNSPLPPGVVITTIYPQTVSCAGLDAFQIRPI